MYNFNDCKPLSEGEISNKKQLLKEYRYLLKDMDVEDYTASDKSKQVRFSKRIFMHNYDNDYNKLSRDMKFKQEYFRIIQIYCYEGPILPKYKESLLKFTEIGDLQKTIRDFFPDIIYNSIKDYLRKNFNKMQKFVGKYDQETEEEDDVSRLS